LIHQYTITHQIIDRRSRELFHHLINKQQSPSSAPSRTISNASSTTSSAGGSAAAPVALPSDEALELLLSPDGYYSGMGKDSVNESLDCNTLLFFLTYHARKCHGSGAQLRTRQQTLSPHFLASLAVRRNLNGLW
jgi:hypothetical protein